MDINDITPEKIERFIKVWRKRHRYAGDLRTLDFINTWEHREDPLGYLYSFLEDYARKRLQRYRLQAGRPPDVVVETSAEMLEQIAADSRIHHSNLHIWSAIWYRYFEPECEARVEDMAAAVSVEARTFRRRVDRGLRELTWITREEEKRTHQEMHSAGIRTRLTTPEYSQLHGTDDLANRICTMLLNPSGPGFISLEGIGGIGKTTQAHVVATGITHELSLVDVIWISARQERLDPRGKLVSISNPAVSLIEVIERLAQRVGGVTFAALPTDQQIDKLAQAFHDRFYLVVIDNLETMEDVTDLLPRLQPLAGKTRFLLTSRHSLRDYDYVYCITVPELSLKESHSLVAEQLTQARTGCEITEAQMQAIYDTVGGIPLALKLIAPQIAVKPLDSVLQDLRRVRGAAGEDNQTAFDAMFDYLYKEVWQLLSEDAQRLLLAIHLSVAQEGAEGADWDWLEAMAEVAGLDQDTLNDVIFDLQDKSLLEVRVIDNSYRYALHRLTITFLQTSIANRFT